MKEKLSIKCKNCKHVVWYDEKEEVWHHKHMLHDDNCECRKPIPNFEHLQKELIKDMDEILKKHKNEPYDYSRGWNSISFEDQHRPFTI